MTLTLDRKPLVMVGASSVAMGDVVHILALRSAQWSVLSTSGVHYSQGPYQTCIGENCAAVTGGIIICE